MERNKVTLIELTQSKRSADRFYAKFDNDEGFTVTINHIADYGLFTGVQLEKDTFDELSAAAKRSAARARAMRMLSARPMSFGEIKDKLIAKGEDESVSEETARWLEELGMINDAEYAAMIVRHYAAKNCGINKIKNELYKRKVPKDLWDEALMSMPEDNEDGIDKLVSAKLRGKEPDRKELKKVSDMLMRRGFTYEEIRSALRRYADNLEE